MRIQPDRLKPILRVEFVLIACVISALLFAPQARGQVPEKDKTQTPPDKTQTLPKFQGTVEIGGQIRDTQGGHDAKFEEVRDVPKGIFIQKLKLDFKSADSPYFLALRGFEIRERDQRFTLDAGRVGKFRTKFMWDQIPHHFGTGQSFLHETAPGFYQVDPALRARLQALTTPEARIAPNSVLSQTVRQELQTAPVTEVRLRRDQALFRQSYQPSNNVELYFQVSWLRNRGTRPMAAGTFVRRAVPAPGFADIGGAWEGMGQEFLEPIDQRTTDLKLGANFRGERWSAGVDYDLSLFRNRVESIIFENPFRVTDAQGVGAANRYRSVRWQNGLPPNNDSHTVSFWARVDLTPQTQVRGLVSLASWRQNDAFLP
ncbi:MAG: MtrB/PioB family outer membrane beta-barrel protein, partial [Actinobacteria bacterium]|nr:MtrB/PioB family outer membrane beta-barrel protein [Actinomycetota bacterium]